MAYIKKRFPNVKSIRFVETPTEQPLGVSCGAYAAAAIWYMEQNNGPNGLEKIRFTTDEIAMRKMLLQFLEIEEKNRKIIEKNQTNNTTVKLHEFRESFLHSVIE